MKKYVCLIFLVIPAPAMACKINALTTDDPNFPCYRLLSSETGADAGTLWQWWKDGGYTKNTINRCVEILKDCPQHTYSQLRACVDQLPGYGYEHKMDNTPGYTPSQTRMSGCIIVEKSAKIPPPLRPTLCKNSHNCVYTDVHPYEAVK